jgi:hypothetical protein
MEYIMLIQYMHAMYSDQIRVMSTFIS